MAGQPRLPARREHPVKPVPNFFVAQRIHTNQGAAGGGVDDIGHRIGIDPAIIEIAASEEARKP